MMYELFTGNALFWILILCLLYYVSYSLYMTIRYGAKHSMQEYIIEGIRNKFISYLLYSVFTLAFVFPFIVSNSLFLSITGIIILLTGLVYRLWPISWKDVKSVLHIITIITLFCGLIVDFKVNLYIFIPLIILLLAEQFKYKIWIAQFLMYIYIWIVIFTRVTN